MANMILWAIIVLLVIITISLIFKLILKARMGVDDSWTCLTGKTAIITGGNTGLGFYTAQEFAKRGARVILACRDSKKAAEAIRKITEATNNANVFTKSLDLSSLESIRKFAKEINETEPRLDILVNNAAVGGIGRQTTNDGLDLLLQVNYFGPFLLTNLLLDLLKKSGHSRVINISSYASKWAILNPDNLNSFPEHMMAQSVHYANSKMYLNLFTVELARRLSNQGVTVNCLHPGTCDTELFRMVPLHLQPLLFFSKFFFKTPQEGAQTQIYLSVSNDVRGLTGLYFDNCRIKSMPKAELAQNEVLRKKIWEGTEKLVKLTREEIYY